MILLDVNVVLAAYRADHPHHPVRPWLEGALGSGEKIAVPDLVWVAFIRLVTNRRIFTIPTPLPEAFAFVGTLTAHPAYLPVPALNPDRLGVFKDTCLAADATANLAALATTWACPLATLNHDFHRFPHLRTITPSG